MRTQSHHFFMNILQYFKTNIAIMKYYQSGSNSKRNIFLQKRKEGSLPFDQKIILSKSQLIIIYILSMFNNSMNNMQNNSGFRKLSAPSTDTTSTDLNNLGFANQMMQVINAQHCLIAKLLSRQNQLYQEFRQKFSSSGSSSGSAQNMQMAGYRPMNNLDNSRSGSPIEGSGQDNWKQRKAEKGKNYVISNNTNKKEFIEDQGSSFEEDEENSEVMVKTHPKRKQTQTKNMVKNFAKAIFNFILKNREKRQFVLNKLGICQEEFVKHINGLKGKVHSISELRALWIPEGNIYHQAFRMFSGEYLRKYCLARTFNSRVENFMIHLKYRERLLVGLEYPQEFTALKTN